MRMRHILAVVTIVCIQAAAPCRAGEPFGIRVVDGASGRGVPLVELETVNHIRFVTDSADGDTALSYHRGYGTGL